MQKLELGETLVGICRDKDMPGQSTVNTWMREDDKFKDKVLDARRMGAMVWLDKCQELLDQEVEPQKVQWYREKLHHARWLVSKLVNVFGDKQTVVNEGDPVIQVVWKKMAAQPTNKRISHTRQEVLRKMKKPSTRYSSQECRSLKNVDKYRTICCIICIRGLI